jgi:hypothetical protein
VEVSLATKPRPFEEGTPIKGPVDFLFKKNEGRKGRIKLTAQKPAGLFAQGPTCPGPASQKGHRNRPVFWTPSKVMISLTAEKWMGPDEGAGKKLKRHPPQMNTDIFF